MEDNLTLMDPFVPERSLPMLEVGDVVDVSAATSSVVVNATASHSGGTVETSSGDGRPVTA